MFWYLCLLFHLKFSNYRLSFGNLAFQRIDQKMESPELCCYLPKAKPQERGLDKELKEIWKWPPENELMPCFLGEA